MSIAYRGISNTAGEGGQNTSITLTKPSTSQGDLMIAFFCVEDGFNPVNNVPTGWTLVNQGGRLAARSHWLYIYTHTAGASEPSTYQWGFSATYEAWGGIVSLYDNASGSCGLGNGGTTSTDSNTDGNAPAPSINIQTANNWALHISSTMRGTTSTPPSGSPTYTERLDGQSGTGTSNLSIAMSSAVYASTGGTGIKTAVFADADYKMAVHLEITTTGGGGQTYTENFSLGGSAAITPAYGLVLDSLFTLGAGAADAEAASRILNPLFSLQAEAGKTLAGTLVANNEFSLPAEGSMSWLANLIMDAGMSLTNSADTGLSGGMNFAEALALVANATEAVAPHLTVAQSMQLQAHAVLAAAAQQNLLAQLGITAGAAEGFSGTGIWDRTVNLAGQAAFTPEDGFIFQAQLILNATSLVGFDRILAIFKEAILGASAGDEAQATFIGDALFTLGVSAEQMQAAFRTIELGISLAAEALLGQAGTVLGAPPLPDIIVAALRALTDPQRIRPEVDEWRVRALEDPGRIKH